MENQTTPLYSWIEKYNIAFGKDITEAEVFEAESLYCKLDEKDKLKVITALSKTLPKGGGATWTFSPTKFIEVCMKRDSDQMFEEALQAVKLLEILKPYSKKYLHYTM